MARLLALLLIFLSFLDPLAAQEPVCDSSDPRECHSGEEDEEVDGDPGEIPWWTFNHTLDDFEVAGVNLASYIPGQTARDASSKMTKEEPFELYSDFDISHLVRGDETWTEIIDYRNKLQRPSLSFYVDKVARKRWLPQQGFHQPETYALKYKDELEAASFQDYAKAILELLPTDKSYCAKPTHMSLLKGNWLVNYEDGKTHFSRRARKLEEGNLDFEEVATSIASSLHQPPDEEESWALKNVKPGFVVEELYKAHDDPFAPPHEINIFTIWGRVWIGQWSLIENQNRWCMGMFYRNGTVAGGSAYGHEHGYSKPVPDWIPWTKLVELAETLGAHKDMFRTDVFVGIPKMSSDTELKIAVSECEIFPTTIFGRTEEDVGLQNEGARLWAAGYKIGNYKLIDNTEVPADYVDNNP